MEEIAQIGPVTGMATDQIDPVAAMATDQIDPVMAMATGQIDPAMAIGLTAPETETVIDPIAHVLLALHIGTSISIIQTTHVGTGTALTDGLPGQA